MTGLASPDTTSAKIIEKSQIHEFVEREKNYLRARNEKKGQPIDEAGLNSQARDRIAARIKLERLRRENARLVEESERDSMTGLLNRKGFEKMLNIEVNRMERTGSKSTIIYADINGLKETNDSLGHDEGDRLITGTADALRKGSRIVDILSRNGQKADEYLIILPDTDLEEAMIWWNRVDSLFKETGIKISAGMTLLDCRNPEESKEISENAMYRAKRISKANGINEILSHEQLESKDYV